MLRARILPRDLIQHRDHFKRLSEINNLNQVCQHGTFYTFGAIRLVQDRLPAFSSADNDGSCFGLSEGTRLVCAEPAARHAESNLSVEARPRTRVSQESDLLSPGGIPGVERISLKTLKLFVFSDVWRRSVLRSSKRSTWKLQSCVPVWDAPSLVGFPSPPAHRETTETDQSRQRRYSVIRNTAGRAGPERRGGPMLPYQSRPPHLKLRGSRSHRDRRSSPHRRAPRPEHR
jgi:hypothetical protein